MEQIFKKKYGMRFQKIPKGKVRTYKELAKLIGKPKSSRAVANACGKNPYPIKIPCHRVIRSDGSLGGYSGKGVLKQKKIFSKRRCNYINLANIKVSGRKALILLKYEIIL